VSAAGETGTGKAVSSSSRNAARKQHLRKAKREKAFDLAFDLAMELDEALDAPRTRARGQR
jgi:hypothetical protein